jgi:hypothetical protein
MPVKAALPPRTPRRRITPNLDAHRLGPRAANVRACRIFVSAGPGRDALKVMPEFPVLYSTGGQVGTVAYTRCVRRTGPVLCRPGSDGDRTHLDGRHEANVLPVPHEGTCQGVPPLRREPYAGLRRVSHEQCPERSRRRGRRVLARRLGARADRRSARAAGGAARDVRAAPRGAARVPGNPRRRAGRGDAARIPGRDEGRAAGRLAGGPAGPGPGRSPGRDHRPGRSQAGQQRTDLWREDLHGRLRGQQHADVRQPGHRAA